jgi:hypothetical protein
VIGKGTTIGDEGVRDSRHSKWPHAAFTAILVIATLCLAPSPAAAVDPAVSEYSLNFPNSKGKSYPGSETPTARPKELPPIVRRALSDSARENGKALAALATAPELGAPERPGLGSASDEVGGGETPSVPTATFRALGDAPVILGLLGLLGMIGFLGFLARSRSAGKEA